MKQEKVKRLTRAQWEEISDYDLPAGTLLKLNMHLFNGKPKNKISKVAMDMIGRINKKYCPKDSAGYSCQKLGVTRFNKILSGAEYNRYIVAGVMKEAGME
jgi:hypothetical protein